MKTKVFLAIGIRIVILFAVGMAATFIPEQLRDFFGDTLHVHNDTCKKVYDGCAKAILTYCGSGALGIIGIFG